MDYRSRLLNNAPKLPYPLSGIICTIGPASHNLEMLMKLLKAGMRVARFNFSHGTHEHHMKTIKTVRRAIKTYANEMGVYKPVAIALDTKGPEIRTGLIAGGPSAEIELNERDDIKLTTNKDLETKGSNAILYVDYANLPKIVKPGNLIFIDDGLVSLKVTKVDEQEISCTVVNGGKLGSRKGVNLPGIPVDLPNISEQDKKDLQFGVDQNVDMIFASFIRSAKALKEIREILGPNGKHIKIISKIENEQGLHNIDSIVEASDGIMVARGDLGIEIPTEHVVLAQKCIIAKCNKSGKPVICATQMLESMISKPRPTRAEASDVANAIFDGADCVMLSGETAKGKYPEECVKCMGNICAKVESVLWYEHIQNEIRNNIKMSGADGLTSVASGIAEIASLGHASAIVVASRCAIVAQLICQHRPRCPIVMLTHSPTIARQSVIYRGVNPIVMEDMENGCTDFETILAAGLRKIEKLNLVPLDTPIILMTVDALKAENLSFRLMSIKLEPLDEKCKHVALVLEKSSKKGSNQKCKKQSDTTKSDEQVKRCKQKSEDRKKREDAQKIKNASSDISRKIMDQANSIPDCDK